MQASSFTKSRKLLRCSTFQLWAMSCKAVCITSRFCWLVNSTAKPPTRSTRANSLNTEGYKRWFSSKDPNCLPKGRSVMILSTEASDNGNPPKVAALARSNCNGPPLRWFLRPREAMFEAAMRSCSGSKSQPIKTPGNHNWKQLSSKIAVLAFVKVRFNKFQPDKPFLQKKTWSFCKYPPSTNHIQTLLEAMLLIPGLHQASWAQLHRGAPGYNDADPGAPPPIFLFSKFEKKQVSATPRPHSGSKTTSWGHRSKQRARTSKTFHDDKTLASKKWC